MLNLINIKSPYLKLGTNPTGSCLGYLLSAWDDFVLRLLHDPNPVPSYTTGRLAVFVPGPAATYMPLRPIRERDDAVSRRKWRRREARQPGAHVSPWSCRSLPGLQTPSAKLPKMGGMMAMRSVRRDIKYPQREKNTKKG
jgi:hypothetical protein